MPPVKHQSKLGIILPFILLLCVVGYPFCHHPKTQTIPWGSWNILFKDGSTADLREGVTRQIEDTLTRYLADEGIDTSKVHASFHAYFCPCDSTLVSLNATIINESGNPVTPPPPGGIKSGNGLGGSEFYSPDVQLSTPESANTLIVASDIPQIRRLDSFLLGYRPRRQQSDDPVLAVIDTGLDTTAFTAGPSKNAIGSLVWKDPSGRPTLYNFIPGANQEKLVDDDAGIKHGTSVTYVALLAAGRTFPRIMVLKALDSAGRGSIFTISCAMSYAIKHKATVINASLGYAGTEDPILKKYFHDADSLKIPVAVAAGNDSAAKHNLDTICLNSINHNDSLTAPSNLFYPACFGDQMNYVISVTGVSTYGLPCYYQKFSPAHVYVGVKIDNNQKICCSFLIPFLGTGKYVEGSSFSTPVISGMLIGAITRKPNVNTAPRLFDPRTWLNGKAPQSNTLKPYIESGRYMPYTY